MQLSSLPWSHGAVLPQIATYVVVEKGIKNKGEQTLLEPWCEYWSYSGWQKGISQDEATLSSAEIEPIALVVIKLRLSEGRLTLNLFIKLLWNFKSFLFNRFFY